MSSWHSYPKVYAIGHRAISDLFSQPVDVEEKIDGSQFSFCVLPEGELVVRSKGAAMYIDAPEKMFAKAVDSAKELRDRLTVGWTYRGEYLVKPKHNALAYDRVPRHHVIIFDINRDHEDYLTYDEKERECERLGLEVVPRLFSGEIKAAGDLRRFLDTESILGGQKVEGVVVKPANGNLFGMDKKLMIGKFVSEHFKEVHSAAWKESNPKQNDILSSLSDRYCTQARWEKAVMHMMERGELLGEPRDIGALIKEVPNDIKDECVDEIKDALFAWAWPHIARGSTRGLPQWYKERLLEQQFTDDREVV